jgi:L-fucose isomerase-like protein
MDIGRGEIVDIPQPLRSEWWNGATPQWPLLTADLGVHRDVIMAHYMSNHIALSYGDIFGEMIALCRKLGFKVRIFGKHS